MAKLLKAYSPLTSEYRGDIGNCRAAFFLCGVLFAQNISNAEVVGAWEFDKIIIQLNADGTFTMSENGEVNFRGTYTVTSRTINMVAQLENRTWRMRPMSYKKFDADTLRMAEQDFRRVNSTND